MNEIYQKNLKGLATINPQLANKVNNFNKKKDGFKVDNTKKNNHYTLRIKINDNYKLVHSEYRPGLQAQRVIDGFKLGYYNLIGVAGIGCGHYIREILSRFNKESQLIIFENRLDILKEVMKKEDLTDIFKPRNVKIFDGTEKRYITQLKNQMRRIDYNALAAGNVNFFKTPVLKEVEREKYDEFRKRFFSTINFLARTVGNDPGDTIIGIKHAFQNLEYILNSPLLSKLKDYKNKPAVLVAAGPSLDKNIDVLKKYQDKVLIIAADTVLEKLLNNGIKPDIVGVLERLENVYNYFFKNLAQKNKLPEDLTLIAEGIIHPKIYKSFPGKKISLFRGNVPVEKWFVENLEGILGLNTGNSVANLNFSVARVLGCSPIILIGQDLSFSPDGKAHTGETGYDEHGDINLDKENRRELVEVEGYNGEKLLAKKWWKIFKEWFEHQIVEHDIHCIDATEGGALIKGTELMTLQEVADIYFKGRKEPFVGKIQPISKELVTKRVNSLLKAIENKIDNFKEVEERIELIIDFIEDTLKDFEVVDNILSFVEKKFTDINTEIAIMSNMDGFIFFICQSIFIDMERYKVKMGDISINAKEKFINWCNYDLDKLYDIKRIVNIVINIFNEGLEKIKERV